MIKSFASRIWVRVRFIAFCVISQQSHPPMYFRTLKNCRVNDINLFCLKFIKIMLETSNLAYKYTHMLPQKMNLLVTKPT